MLRSISLAATAVVMAACASVTPATTPTPGPTSAPTASAAPTTAPTATTAPTSAATPAATATGVPTDGPVGEVCGTDWYSTPAICGGEIADRFVFQCPPGGEATAIYGTDTYTDDSSACVAAVHAGLISFATGGSVTVELRAGEDSYVASTRNGVESSSWASWPTSFVFVGAAADPLQALIARIPTHLQGQCGEVTTFDGGAIVSVQCINIPDVDGYVVYTQFDSPDSLDASYQGNVDYFGIGSDGTDCRVGPSQGGYTIDDSPAGQVMCNTYTGVDPNGMILIWTNEALLIEGTLALYGGTFQDMYDIWADAGPIP